MNKNLLFSMLALTTCAFADGDSTSSSTLLADDNFVAGRMDSDCNKPKPVECKPKPKPCNPCVRPPIVTLTTARPACGNGFYAFADALYWHANVGQPDWGYVTNVNPTTALSTPGEYVNNHQIKFGWNWGWRVGLGINMDYDQWDSYVSYTSFNTSTSDSLTANGGVNPALTPAPFPTVPLGAVVTLQGSTTGTLTSGAATGLTSSSFHQSIRYGMFDWDLGRWFHVSKALSLRPHAGIRGGWINQKFKNTYFAPAATGAFAGTRVAQNGVVNESNDFWGVGTEGGFNAKAVLGTLGCKNEHAFSLFADFNGAIMYGHWNYKLFTESTNASTGADVFDATFNNMSLNAAAVMLGSMLGLSYDVGFNDDKARFGVRVGYEFQYWFNQDKDFYFEFDVTGTGRYERFDADLALQGLTIDFRFDF